MSDLLSLHESIDHLTGTGRTYRAFVSSERERVDQILQKYAYISRILTIRPTLDRSLSYHLRIQQYSLSCEITATQIVLEALGILQTESEILDQIPQLPSRLSGGIWGDPDREFVGSYRGSQRGATGYGVYEAPISDVFHRYGFSTQILNTTLYDDDMDASGHLTRLLASLDERDTHVILWADFCTDPSDEDGVFARPGSHIMRFFPLGAKNQCDRPAEERIMRWKTPDGKTIE
jgi:hypothetical protein